MILMLNDFHAAAVAVTTAAAISEIQKMIFISKTDFQFKRFQRDAAAAAKCTISLNQCPETPMKLHNCMLRINDDSKKTRFSIQHHLA